MPRIEPAQIIDRHLDASIWRKGLSLEEAAWEFCPFQFHQRLQEASDPKLMERFSENIRKLKLEDFQATPGLRSSVPLEFIDIVFKPKIIRGEMSTWLQTALGKGKFAAYGDWLPINPRNPPKLIPSEYFQHGEINWTKSLLKMGNAEIVAIKVFRLNWVRPEKLTVEHKSLPASRKQMGRPTRKGAVQKSIAQLVSESPRALDMPPKQLWEEIRRRAKLISPADAGQKENAGLGDKVIQRELAEYRKHQKL